MKKALDSVSAGAGRQRIVVSESSAQITRKPRLTHRCATLALAHSLHPLTSQHRAQPLLHARGLPRGAQTLGLEDGAKLGERLLELVIDH